MIWVAEVKFETCGHNRVTCGRQSNRYSKPHDRLPFAQPTGGCVPVSLTARLASLIDETPNEDRKGRGSHWDALQQVAAAGSRLLFSDHPTC